jgi:hypothetical protein
VGKNKRIFREWQHPRDGKGRFSKRGGAKWAKAASAAFRADAPESASVTRAGDRPRISRTAKADAVFQAHADGGRPSPVRVPQATKTAAPPVKNLLGFNAKGLPTPKKTAAPPVKNLDAFNAPDAPKKRTPRQSPGAAALIAARNEEQAPHLNSMRQARTAPETAPVQGAEAYAAMRRHTLLALARDAGISIRGKSNTEIANELAAHDAKVKADRAAKLNPTGVGTSVDTPRVDSNNGGMTSTTSNPVPSDAELRSIIGNSAPGSVQAMDAQNELRARKLGSPPGALPNREESPDKYNWGADMEERARVAAEAERVKRASLTMQRIKPGEIAVPETGPIISDREDEQLKNLVSNIPASLRNLGNQWAEAVRNGDTRQARTLASELNKKLRDRDNHGTARMRTVISNGTEVAASRQTARDMAQMMRRNTDRFPGEEFRTVTPTEAMQLGFNGRQGGIDTPDMARERLATLRRTGQIMPPGRIDTEDGVADNPDFLAARAALASTGFSPSDEADLRSERTDIMDQLNDLSDRDASGRAAKLRDRLAEVEKTMADNGIAPETPKRFARRTPETPTAAPRMKRAHATALRQIDAKGDDGLHPGSLTLADTRALRDAGYIEERDINAPGRPKRLFLTEAGAAALRDDNPEAHAKREAAKVAAAARLQAQKDKRAAQAAASAARSKELEEQALKEGLDPLTAKIGGMQAARDKKARDDAEAAAAREATLDEGVPTYTAGHGGVHGDNSRASTEAVNKVTKGMLKDGITIEEARAAATEQARAYATAMGRVDSARWDRDEADRRREYLKNLRDLTGDDAYDSRVKAANADQYEKEKALRDRVAEANTARAALEEAVVGAYAAKGKRKAATTLKLPAPDDSYGKAGPSLADRVDAAFTTDRKGPEVRAARAAALARIRQEDHIANLERQQKRHEGEAGQIMRYGGGDSPYPSEERTAAREKVASERAMAARKATEAREAKAKLAKLKEDERRAVEGIPKKSGHEYADVVEAVRAAGANGGANDIQNDPAKEKAYRADIRRRLGLPADDGEPQMAREAIPVAPADVRFGDYVQGGNGGLGFQVAAIERQEDGSIRLTGVGLLGVQTRTVRPGGDTMKVWRPGVSDQNRRPLRDDEADLPLMARRTLEGFTDERDRLAAANRVRASKGLPEKGMTPGRVYPGQFTREAKAAALKTLTLKAAPTEREAKLAAKRAELEAATQRFHAEANRQVGGSSKRKSFGVRIDAQLRRAGEHRRDMERLEREIAALERPEAPKAGPVNFDDIKPGGIVKRDGQYYRVLKVNAKSIKLEMPPGMDDLFKKDHKITEVHPPKADAVQVTAPARGRFSPDAKREALGRVDTSRVKSQNGDMNPTDETDARIQAETQAKRAAVREALSAATTEREARDAIAHLNKPALIRIYREQGGHPSQNIDEAVLRRAIVNHALGTGGSSETRQAARPGESTLGVTESSRGRTTTVTLPDGSTAQRTSKTMAYTHAVVATRDLHAEARYEREVADRHEAFAAALEAWIADGSDMSKLKRIPTGTGSLAMDRAGIKNYGYYLPGFEPNIRTGKSGAKWAENPAGSSAVETRDLNRDGTPVPLKDWEEEYHGPAAHRESVDSSRRAAVALREKAAKLEAGPQQEHFVVRWSQSYDNAAKGSGEFEQMRNTSLQIIGVGGAAKAPTKPAKHVPTREEKAAAREAQLARQKADRAISDQAFADRTRANIINAIDNGGDPEDELRAKSDIGLRFLAKAVGAKIPRKPRTAYGTPAPLDRDEARKLIVEAIRREHLGKNVSTEASGKPGTARSVPDLTGGAGATRNTDGTIRVGGLREGQQWVTPGGIVVENPSQRDIILGKVKLRQSPAATGNTGPGNAPIGATDADRLAAQPRIEGESDRAYDVRTSVDRASALRKLDGHTVAGLRAIARDEGVVASSKDTKATLMERLMRVMYDRHADSRAITDMVNRDRTPVQPKVKAEDLRTGDMVQVGDIWGVVQGVQVYSGTNLPTEVRISYDGGARKEWVALNAITAHESRRANAPTVGGSITPTMTGAQLIAARRKLQAEQQGRRTQ